MKKLLFIFALATAMSVQADYLYWMVGSDIPDGKNFIGQTVKFSSWTDAKLFYNGNLLNGGSLTRDTANTLADINAYAYTDIGDYNNRGTFMIELYNSGSYLGFASAEASALRDYVFASSGMSTNVGKGWVPPSFAVPEPTSGLLFLLGGVLLGLKRRRMA
jgi:hypothetical protein